MIVTARRGRAPARLPADQAYFWVSTVIALSLVVVLAAIIAVLVSTAWPAITRVGLNFFTGTTWDASRDLYGAVPFFVGTIITTALALIFAVPLSVAIAILLTEYMPRTLAVPISMVIDVAAGVPTIVFGAWAVLALVPWLRDSGEPAIQAVLGWLPIFATPPIGYLTGQGMFATGIVLGAMVFPTIVAVTRNSFVATSRDLREASFGLGATRWETATRVVLRQARAGMFGAIVLASGRALGEAIAVIFIIGTTPQIPRSLFDVGDTMSSHLLTQVLGALPGTLNTAALYELGLVLLALSMATSLVGRLLTRRLAGVAAMGSVAP